MRTKRYLVYCTGIVVVLIASCADPEDPSITQVKLFTKDIVNDTWNEVDLARSQGVVDRSPIRIQGVITDNTAVVDPTLTMEASRTDLIEGGGGGHAGLPVMCELKEEGSEYLCWHLGAPQGPALTDDAIVAGDYVEVVAKHNQGDSSIVQVLFTDYGSHRVVRFKSAQGSSIDLTEHVRLYTCSSCGDTASPEPVCTPKQSGDSWVRGDDTSRCLKIGIDAEQVSEPTVVVKSLSRWQVISPLDVNPKTGFFSQEFQLIDPRRQGLSQAVYEQEGATTYTLMVAARDAADQKTGKTRTSRISLTCQFDPSHQEQERPVIFLNEAQEHDVLDASGSTQRLSGILLDNAGEPRQVCLTISNEPPPDELTAGNLYTTEPYYYDLSTLSLKGVFALSTSLISDWDGDGIVDSRVRVWNKMSLTVRDRNDTGDGPTCSNGDLNCVTFSFWVGFKPPQPDTSSPNIAITETIPAWDHTGVITVRSPESLRIRGTAWDDAGQPEVEWLVQACEAWSTEPEDNVNVSRCRTVRRGTFPTDITGQFPAGQWEWLEIPFSDLGTNTHIVFVAREKKASPYLAEGAKCTGLEIAQFVETPYAEQPTLTGSVSSADTRGPLVTVTLYKAMADQWMALRSGDVIGVQEHLKIEGTILPRSTTLKEVVALMNGRVPTDRGMPSYMSDSVHANFSWDLGTVTLAEGDEITVGGRSVTGHMALSVVEFSGAPSDGLRVAISQRETNEFSQAP